MILVDMIGEKNPAFKRESQSTAWLTDAIWSAAHKLGRREFLDESLEVDDDHLPFLAAGVPAVDIIDIDYAPWHTEGDTLDKVSRRAFKSSATSSSPHFPRLSCV